MGGFNGKGPRGDLERTSGDVKGKLRWWEVGRNGCERGPRVTPSSIGTFEACANGWTGCAANPFTTGVFWGELPHAFESRNKGEHEFWRCGNLNASADVLHSSTLLRLACDRGSKPPDEELCGGNKRIGRDVTMATGTRHQHFVVRPERIK